MATVSSSSLLTVPRSRSAKVVGRPTLMQKETNSLYSRVGRSSRANWVRVPKLTFSPCMKWCDWGSAVRPLWTAWAAARPPLSNPSPDSRVLASTTFSRAGVTTCCWAACLAEKP